MINNKTLLLLLVIATTLVGCSSSPPSGAGGASYTEQLVMSLFRQNPERALAVADSAVATGNITPRRGQYLKALTLYNGLGQYHKSRQMCLDLLAEKAPAQPSLADSLTTAGTHILLASIGRSLGNDIEVLRHATEASRLAHQLRRPAEVSKMAGYIAEVKQHQGLTDEAFNLLQQTISQLRDADSFEGVNAYFSLSKQLLHLQIDEGQYNEMLPVCQTMLNRIEQLHDHPERFVVPENLDLADYIDFARGQSCAFFCAANALLGRKAEVRRWESEMQRTQWSKTLDCDRMMMTTYLAIGDWDRLDRAFQRSEDRTTDTLSHNYLIILRNKSIAAKRRGQTAQALAYLERAYTISDSLNSRQMQQQMAELSTAYHLQEETEARQKETMARQQAETTMCLALIAVACAIAFALYFFYKRRQTTLKNKALVRLIDEQNSNLAPPYPRTPAPSNSNLAPPHPRTSAPPRSVCKNHVADPSAFDRLNALIYDQQLYRDPLLGRETVCQQLDIDRHTLNQLLNDFADGQSLPAFINKVRLNMACKMLRDEPHRPIADIAEAVGFNQRNFRTQFKNAYGISPTEYRKNM